MQKAKAIFFLFLFLLSQVSFSAELHYCHSQLTDVSFAGKANCVCLEAQHDDHNEEANNELHKGHCHEDEKKCGHDEEDVVVAEDDCCSTQNLEVEKSNDLVEHSKLTLENDIIFTDAFNPVFGATVSILDILPQTYIPPLLVKDHCVLLQTFLI